MSQRARKALARFDRVIDAAVGAGLTISGLVMIIGYAQPKALTDTIHYLATFSWATVLTLSALAILIGTVLRTERTGRQQSYAYGLELGGWSFSFGAVFVYAIANTASGGSAAGDAALFVLAALLLGRFVRLWGNVWVARQEVGN